MRISLFFVTIILGRMSESSLLDIIRACHNHNPWYDSTLHPLLLSPAGPQIGFLPPQVFEKIVASQAGFEIDYNKTPASVSFLAAQNQTQRSEVLAQLTQSWRAEKAFPDPLDGWRDELYDIYGLNGQVALKLERSACALFGFATFGVHLTAFTQETEIEIWVPRRSKTKPTWPGVLDNSVAGGISSGDKPMQSILRECEEEASLSSELVKRSIKNTGVISYFYQTKSGFCQPEVEYTYDLLLPSNVVLTPADGEAESFERIPWQKVLKLVRLGEFKPNCALVLIDFFIRHGLLRVEDEPDYLEISSELKNKLGLPGP